jgi:hypothetical protein
MILRRLRVVMCALGRERFCGLVEVGGVEIDAPNGKQDPSGRERPLPVP